MTAAETSMSSRAVFAAKHCQGGGVTWAGILGVLTRRRGATRPVADPMPGWSGDVKVLSWKRGTARVSIDDEADAARFCSDSPPLLSAIGRDVERLNADRAELERAMGEADPLALECLPDGMSVDDVLRRLTPPPSPP